MLDLSPPTYPVLTPRLRLRPFVADDYESLYAYRSQPDVLRYVYRPVATRESAMLYLGKSAVMHPERDGDWLTLGVELPGRDGVIGEVGLGFTAIEKGQGEIGYIFSPDVAGEGYATEAVRALITMAFEHVGFHRLVARIDEENMASVALAKRLSMRHEARLVENDIRDGAWSSELVYAVLDREWASRS